MRERCDALQLPVVLGHGDLKPSNVMLHSEAGARREGICFIDFELSGNHYRGYDLFKLFRTSQDMSHTNLRAFLADYSSVCSSSAAGECGAPIVSLEELEAETYAAEPLTWLEAAVFFLFAVREYPEQRDAWEPLARHRWESYLATASVLDSDGDATRALQAARRTAPAL